MGNTIIDKIDKAGKQLSAIANTFAPGSKTYGGKVLATLVGYDLPSLGTLLDMVNNQPVLACVPIQAEEISMRRQCDVGTTMLISQTNQNKDYFTDNVAPRPRTWSVRGYIASLNPSNETGLLIKPSIIIQCELLNIASESRSKVKFKTDTGEVVDVFITELQLSANARGNNVRSVSVTVQEVKTLSSSESLVSKYDLDEVGANSIVKNTCLNMGNLKSLGVGITSSVGTLLKLPL